MGARQAAVRALLAVVADGQSLAAALPALLERVADTRERPLAQELAYGTLRWYPRLTALVGQLLQRPLKPRDQDIHALLLVGVYQLAYLAMPAHAAVHETVETARALGKPWAAKLVNGVLRNFQRRESELVTALDRDPVTRLAHPGWLLESFRHDWPADWEALAAANNARPPLCLRVNTRRLDRPAYLAALAQAGIDAVAMPHAPEGVELSEPMAVERLPGYAEGWFSVQDGAAQQAAHLLDPQAGMGVLDACAAPGGKTAHMLERQPELARLTAIDMDPARLQRVGENLQRLGLEAQLVAGDAAAPDSWWDGDSYQRILLDAPCSATGVIRRHPDIKVLRRRADIPRLVDQQRRLLEALWSLLAPGGMLLYATCSVVADENADQVERFLATHPDAREWPIDAPWGRACQCGRQILPGQDGMDGFYYARLVKR
ncbi:MAG TPA: 16S rRNA (cytosine(967)-C(5))-methyltransferase RsmB [Gammaproteobacteria bacterium]|nr:16S rRNA (cytosine(967)-C(5))-methyltransferase RsmB [Gammaproteobacteria bacterium]